MAEFLVLIHLILSFFLHLSFLFFQLFLAFLFDLHLHLFLAWGHRGWNPF
jgi:hypothetical protein